MPVGPDLYVDGISVRALITKAKVQAQKSQQAHSSSPRSSSRNSTTPTPTSGPMTGSPYSVGASENTSRKFDTTLEDIKATPKQNLFSGTIETSSNPEPANLYVPVDGRTATQEEFERLKHQKPAYYDPSTQTAYTGLGVFLAGMGSLVRRDIDPTKLDPLAKAEYYAGRAAAEVGLAYGLGTALGGVLGRAPEIVNTVTKSRAKPAVDVASKVLRPARKVFSNPKVVKAITGTLKGLWAGSEVAKGIEIKMNGGTWGDVVGTLGGDFAGMYAFEKGLTSAFATTRRNVIRKNFAKKNSRIFAGQIYKRSPVVMNDPNQERLTTTLIKREEFPLEFRPRRPQAPYGTPKYDVVKLPKEVPGNDVLITGTINTKSKPRTAFRLETADDADDVIDASKLLKKAKEKTRQLATTDEMKFLEQEKGLPEQLYTSDEKLLESLFGKSKKTSGLASGKDGSQKTVQITKSTLKKVSIGKIKASEATRAMKTKSEFYMVMKNAQRNIARATDLLSSGSYAVGVVALPELFDGPPKRISPPPQIIKPPHKESTNTDMGTNFGQNQNKNQGQTVGINYPRNLRQDFDWPEDHGNNQPQKQNHGQGQDEPPKWYPPLQMPAFNPPIWHPPGPPQPRTPKPSKKPRLPGTLLPKKPRKPRVKLPTAPYPLVGGMFAGSSGYKGPWIGWGRKNDTPLFTITPIKVPNLLTLHNSKRKGGKRSGIL